MERTFNQMIGDLIDHVAAERQLAESGDEGRDLSLTITHLEDARTRYNSSRYRRQGTWHIHDPDLGQRAEDPK